ncbi:MAG: hypothetical protein PHN75_18240 [Syntrophales bacterium]|nr:hypothetical protein [Syntrophales bacterium]
MLNFMKRAILMGAGLALMTTDKMKELTDEMVKKGELSEKEAREALAELKEKSKEAKKEWEGKVENAVRRAMKGLNIPSHQEVEELKKRLAKLEHAQKAKE